MDVLSIIIEEIQGVLGNVDRDQLEDFISILDRSKRIFVMGEGRSGLMAKGFAMRLMHLGYRVYVVGETITPPLEKDDIFIAVSGSGESSYVVSDTQKASEKGCTVALVTSRKNSAAANLASRILIVPGTIKSESAESRKSVQLLSSLFDQCLHIVLDAVCLMVSMRDEVINDQAARCHW